MEIGNQIRRLNLCQVNDNPVQPTNSGIVPIETGSEPQHSKIAHIMITFSVHRGHSGSLARRPDQPVSPLSATLTGHAWILHKNFRGSEFYRS